MGSGKEWSSKMSEIIKNATIKNYAFWVCLIVSIGLEITGMLLPPMGKIDGSVLTGVGILFGFATLYTVGHAIDKGIDAKFTHGNTTLVVGDLGNDKSINKQTTSYEETDC